jgi:hypothetical protein
MVRPERVANTQPTAEIGFSTLNNSNDNIDVGRASPLVVGPLRAPFVF